MRGEEVFENLKRQKIFDLSLANEAEKREIFLSVWDRCVDRFRRDYNREGFGRNLNDIGFGYLVEEFARYSLKLSRNTSFGDHAANLLLGFLRNGDESGVTSFKKSLYNPDFLHIKITGRLIVVTGLVEVKSSAEALRTKLDSQISGQEPNLRKLVSSIQENKEAGRTYDFFRKRKIIVAEKLDKTIAVPLGEGDKARAILPVDWKCVELEFSYQELVFVARAIWPGFIGRDSFQSEASEGYIAKFEREFLAPLVEFTERRIKHVFDDSKMQNVPAREILLSISCLKRIPLLSKDINWIESYFKRRKFFGLFPAYPDQLEALTREDEELLAILMKWYLGLRPGANRENIKEHALFLLSNFKSFSKILGDALRIDKESSARINQMDEFSLNSFIG